jgi:hypothetical protein
MVEQVLLNLTRNAMQAMASAGTADRAVLIQVRRAGTSEHSAKVWLEFSVADHGPGIPDEVAQQLFTPFFTTKAEGMGLGLSLCRTVVEQHGGFLGFEPNPPQGTIFRFTLPADNRPHLMQPVLNATVFIVDDDAGVRDALAWLLRSRRLPSEVFASGEDFDRLLARALCPRPCCLLLDVRMPGMSGWPVRVRVARGLADSHAGDLPHRPCRRAHRGGRRQARRV